MRHHQYSLSSHARIQTLPDPNLGVGASPGPAPPPSQSFSDPLLTSALPFCASPHAYLLPLNLLFPSHRSFSTYLQYRHTTPIDLFPHRARPRHSPPFLRLTYTLPPSNHQPREIRLGNAAVWTHPCDKSLSPIGNRDAWSFAPKSGDQRRQTLLSNSSATTHRPVLIGQNLCNGLSCQCRLERLEEARQCCWLIGAGDYDWVICEFIPGGMHMNLRQVTWIKAFC